jgi:hypothetical protein
MPIAKIDTNDPNIVFYIEAITIIPNISAGLYYKKIIQGAGGSDHHDVIEGDEYRRWSNDDRYIYIYICNKHGLKYVERIEPEYIERNYCMPNEDGSFRDIKEMVRNPAYTGLPPLVITHETIIKGEDGEPLQIQQDNRSVHNDKDLETIKNLQSELDEQKSKIEQINKLLITRGIL